MLTNQVQKIPNKDFCLAILGLICLTSCLASMPTSSLDHLSHNPNAINQALVIGAPISLVGPRFDVENIGSVLADKKYGFGFQVTKNRLGMKSHVLTQISHAAEKTGVEGTLLLYFSSHGLPGEIVVFGDNGSTDARLSTAEMIDAIRSDRETPLKRLILLIDACYSGSWLNEIEAANQLEPFFEEALLVTSSTSTEVSRDSYSGGVFTNSLLSVFKSARESEQNPRFQDLPDAIQGNIESQSNQTMAYRMIPNSIGDEVLFDSTMRIGTIEDDTSPLPFLAVAEERANAVVKALNNATENCNFSVDEVRTNHNFGSTSMSFRLTGRDHQGQTETQTIYALLDTYLDDTLQASQRYQIEREIKRIPSQSFSFCRRIPDTQLGNLVEQDHIRQWDYRLGTEFERCEIKSIRVRKSADLDGNYSFDATIWDEGEERFISDLKNNLFQQKPVQELVEAIGEATECNVASQLQSLDTDQRMAIIEHAKSVVDHLSRELSCNIVFKDISNGAPWYYLNYDIGTELNGTIFPDNMVMIKPAQAPHHAAYAAIHFRRGKNLCEKR